MKTDTQIEAQMLARLLAQIKSQFYRSKPDCEFYQDQRFLKYALTWPAAWLHAKRLRIANRHYERIITQRLRAIKEHGKTETYQQYFPRYLLKCLQDWFTHHGEGLYAELKHVSHWIQMPGVTHRKVTPDPLCKLQTLAQLHQILRPKYNTKTTPHPKTQLELF